MIWAAIQLITSIRFCYCGIREILQHKFVSGIFELILSYLNFYFFYEYIREYYMQPKLIVFDIPPASEVNPAIILHNIIAVRINNCTEVINCVIIGITKTEFTARKLTYIENLLFVYLRKSTRG